MQKNCTRITSIRKRKKRKYVQLKECIGISGVYIRQIVVKYFWIDRKKNILIYYYKIQEEFHWTKFKLLNHLVSEFVILKISIMKDIKYKSNQVPKISVI